MEMMNANIKTLQQQQQQIRQPFFALIFFLLFSFFFKLHRKNKIPPFFITCMNESLSLQKKNFDRKKNKK